jgi:putative inorganic carbon (hco3(-)) transporter
MDERLVFSYGTNRPSGEQPARDRGTPLGRHETVAPAVVDEPRRDWAFVGLMMFTAILFCRPQDTLTPLRVVPIAELAAIFALIALANGRLSRGLPITRLTAELLGVFAMGGMILATAPFSIWPGGAIGTFTDMFSKVILIFVLMVNTLTTPKRIEQFTWLIVLATGYIAFRAMLDYARGINLIENGRVQGAVGGMFKNPNDMALAMVTMLPLAIFLALRVAPPLRRGGAAFCAFCMTGAIIVSHSRSAFLGLAAMALVFSTFLVRRRPGLMFALVLTGALAMPLVPASYWHRIASITDESKDDTGSREARSIVMREAYAAFLANPVTGVGAGMFRDYNPEERQEAWRESHNAVLQVAAELGVFGVIVFGFLLVRGFYAPIQTRRLVRRFSPSKRRSTRASTIALLDPYEQEFLTTHAAAVTAALVGWFACAMFASVAYHWIFYYVLAMATTPRDYLLARAAAQRLTSRSAAAPVVAVSAHA